MHFKKKNQLSLFFNKRRGLIHIKRISKLGKRFFIQYRKLLNYKGIIILSTSRGILTSWEANQHKIGGEVLLHIC